MRETESLFSETPTQLERFITRMCQISVDYTDHMWRTCYILSTWLEHVNSERLQEKI